MKISTGIQNKYFQQAQGKEKTTEIQTLLSIFNLNKGLDSHVNINTDFI